MYSSPSEWSLHYPEVYKYISVLNYSPVYLICILKRKTNMCVYVCEPAWENTAKRRKGKKKNIFKVTGVEKERIEYVFLIDV